MFTQKLSKYLIILFMPIVISLAQWHENEPILISPCLRLAAMGNLHLVVEDTDNEINAYDFGKSPAGLIDDDEGKSKLYIPMSYGRSLYDEMYKKTWHSGKIRINTVYKLQQALAIGNSFMIAGAQSEVMHGRKNETYSKNVSDTIVFAYRIIPQITVGCRANFYNFIYEYKSHDFDYSSKHKITSLETSFLSKPIKNDLQFGLNHRYCSYQRSEMWYDTISTNTFTIPIIYRSHKLVLGIKGSLIYFRADLPFDTTILENSIGLRTLYKIPFAQKSFNIGMQLNRNTLHYYDPHGYSMQGWKFDFAVGMAFLNENIGLFGVQYQKNTEYHEDVYFDDSYDFGYYLLNFGTELYLLKDTPFRLGYVIKDFDYYFVDFITFGFSADIPKINALISFAYNCKTKHNEAGDIPPPKRHILGLSWKIIF